MGVLFRRIACLLLLGVLLCAAPQARAYEAGDGFDLDLSAWTTISVPIPWYAVLWRADSPPYSCLTAAPTI